MAILGSKKVVIPQHPGGPVPDPATRKEGVPFHNLFNLSGVRTPGKSVTSVLEKPAQNVVRPRGSREAVSPVQSKTSGADLGVIRNWVAMEEKIVHDPGPAPKVAEKKSVAGAQKVPGVSSSKQGAPLRGFFNFSKPRGPGKEVPKARNESVAKVFQPKVAKTDLKAVASWVAMEEKIVHGPEVSDKRDSGDKKFKKIRILGPQVPQGAGRGAFGGKVSLGGFFSFLKPQSSRENPSSVAKESQPPKEVPVRALPLDLSKVNVAAVKNWVASEEETIHESRESKPSAVKDAGLAVKAPQKSLSPVPLVTRTAVSLPREPLSIKEPVRESERTSQGLRTFLWVLGWVAAVAVMFFYVREVSLTYEAEQRSSRLQNEKNRLEQSYATLKSVSDDQAAEMIWLRSQLEDMTWELKGTRDDIATLRNTVRTKDEIVQALKAQTEALEKIISEREKSAVLSTSASATSENDVQPEASAVRGQITSINDQQGFIVVNVGSSQGIHSGQWIMITRLNKKLGFGRVDRVYPTLSVAALRDPKMFQTVREGDSVFFS